MPSTSKPPVSLPSSPSSLIHSESRSFPWIYAFWKFSRPHTIAGTSFSVLGLSTMAWALSNRPELSLPALWPIVLALVTCLCGNIYIVGLNQLEDVEIDRINKPHLPLASGEFSLWQGWVIVGITGLLALVLSLLQGPFLAATVWLSVLIGTAYSLSPIRLKRFPFWASLCIFTVRGAIVNLGLFLHFRQVWNSQAPLEIPPTISALTLFILVFTFAIAILKDVPDLEGDRLYCISTFTVRLGGQTVFNLARWVLTLCYGSMILAGNWITGSQPEFLVISHLLLVIGMWWRSWLVDLSDRVAIARFYQFVWKLFFLEYLIFSAACLLVW